MITSLGVIDRNSLRQRVFRTLQAHPEYKIGDLLQLYVGEKRPSLCTYLSAYHKKNPAPPKQPPLGKANSVRTLGKGKPNTDDLVLPSLSPEELLLSRMAHAEDKDAWRYFEIYFAKSGNNASSSKRVDLPPLSWDWATPKQIEVRDLMVGGHAFIYGDRQGGGKTTVMFAAWLTVCELSLAPINLTYINTAKDKSSKILTKLMLDPLWKGTGITERVKSYIATSAITWKGDTFNVSPANPESAKGPTKDIIVIDDLESLLRKPEGPAVVAAAVGQTRTKPNAHVWFLSNNSSGMFRTLRDAIQKELEFEFPVMELLGKDNDFIDPGQNKMCEVVMTAVMGEEYKMSQLYNFDVNTEGEWFDDTDAVDRAFFPTPFPTEFIDLSIGVDYGFEHPAGCMGMGRNGNNVYELDSWETKHLSASETVTKVKELHDRLSAKYNNGMPIPIHFEIGYGGKGIAKDLRKLGLKVIDTFFTVEPKKKVPDEKIHDDAIGVPKLNTIGFLKKLIEDERIFLVNDKLKGEIRRYCGDKRFDDLFDASLHCIARYNKPGWIRNAK